MAERELPEFGKVLPRNQFMIFERLHRSRGIFVPTDHLIHTLYADDTDGGPLDARKTISVLICYLRKRLPPGWAIENVWGRGYRLVEPSQCLPDMAGPLRHPPDISVLTAIIEKVETAVADKQETLSTAAADLARTVGPLAAAHRLAELAMEMADLADQEANREKSS